MATVLCFGDSYTYGYNPVNGQRYAEDIRWTARLQDLLGKEYKVIEEGCNGRTTVFDDPREDWKKGLPYLRPCLNTHKPVDIVILMLGTNDLKEWFHASAAMIAEGASQLVDVIKDFTKIKQGFVPRIILMAPPEIGEKIKDSPFYGNFREDAISRSREFSKLYEKVAKEKGCVFVNAAEYAKASDEDSVHLTPLGHKNLADVLAFIILNT